jgi:4-amino-4-deoxy-L-arabinose transferase-like glycosyltransferase
MARLLNSRPVHYLLLMIVTAALTLPGLGSISLWDIDEGLNAEAAREMLESGDWVVPTFNFKPRTAKPALLYWLQALTYQRFGVNEFGARLPSVIAGAVAVLLAYELGRRMFSPIVGLLGGVVTISTIQVSVLVHAATPDALLLSCMMLVFWLFWIGSADGSQRWAWMIGPACGLAVLAKGPVGLAMPCAIIGYYFVARRQTARLFDRRVLIGLGLALATAGPWYVLVGVETRGRFLKTFWHMENVGRFMAPMDGHGGGMAYYPLALLVGLAPWSVLLWPVLRDALCSVTPRAEGAADSAAPSARGEMSAVTFLICWVAVYVGFFSLAQTKLPNYILPAYPPLALLTARFLIRWQSGDVTVRTMMPAAFVALAMVGIGVALGLVLCGGAIGDLPATIRRGIGPPIAGLARSAWIGLILVAGAVVAAWCLRRGRHAVVVTSLAATAVIFLALASALPLRAIENRKACRALVAAAGARREKDEIRIACLQYFQPSLVFYCQREVADIFTPEQALDLLRGPLPAYVFCPAEVGERIAGRGQYRVTDRRRDLYRGIDVVVVSNR